MVTIFNLKTYNIILRRSIIFVICSDLLSISYFFKTNHVDASIIFDESPLVLSSSLLLL